MLNLNLLNPKIFFDETSFGNFMLEYSDNIVLYGAGNLGKSVKQKLQSLNITPIAFLDDTFYAGEFFIDNIPVFTHEEGINKLPKDILIIVCICNSKHRFLNTKEKFNKLGFINVYSFYDLIKTYPNVFSSYYSYDTNDILFNHEQELKFAYSLLSDDLSRKTFREHLNFRLSNDYRYIPLPLENLYFPDYLKDKMTDKMHFIDCGAYVGDTLDLFENRYKICFKKISAFEADADNFIQLEKYIANQVKYPDRNLCIYNMAIGLSNGIVSFSNTGTEGSVVSELGDTQVQMTTLENYIDNADTFIKFDIEGAEVDALKGAINALSKYKPIMAISAYHKPSDLWEIPILLKEINSDYKISLTTEGEDGLGLVYYSY